MSPVYYINGSYLYPLATALAKPGLVQTPKHHRFHHRHIIASSHKMRACRYSPRPRPELKSRLKAQASHSRSFHQAKAHFTTMNHNGFPVSCETEIRVGESHEAYIYVEPDIGNAIISSITRQTGMGLTRDRKKLSLYFDHRSHYFAHSSFPRRILILRAC